MVDFVTTGERIAKLGLGVAKLIVGGERVGAVKEIFDLIADGRKIHADLTSEAEKALAAKLAKAAEDRIASLARTHEWSPAALKTAELHLNQAVSLCRPEGEVFAQSGMKADSVVDHMRWAVVARGGELGEAYRDETPSRKLFEQTVTPVIRDLVGDAEFVEKIAPALWRSVLGTLGQLDDRTRSIEAATTETRDLIREMSEKEQIAERALRAIFQAFYRDRQEDAVLMSVREIARAVLPEVQRFREQRAHLLTPTGENAEENARRRRAADLMDDGRFEEARALLASVSESRLDRARQAADAAATLLAEASDALGEEAQAALLAGDVWKAIELLAQAIELTDETAMAAIRRKRELGSVYVTFGEPMGNVDMALGGLRMLLDIEHAFEGPEAADIAEEVAEAALSMSSLDNTVDWLSLIQPSVERLVFHRFASEDEAAIAKTCLLQSRVYLGLAIRTGRSDYLNMAGSGFHGVAEMAEKLGDGDLHISAYAGLAATQKAEGSADMIRNAIQTFESLLDVLEVGEDRWRIANFKLDLSSALSALHSRIDNRREQVSLLSRSERIYAELEQTYPKSKAPYFWSRVRQNLAGVKIAQAAIERDPAKAQEAERICDELIVFAEGQNLSKLAHMAEIRRGDARRFAERLSLAAG